MAEIGSRSGKIGRGRYEYRQGEYLITRMGAGNWYVWLRKEDTGQDFKTLGEARNWCKRQCKEKA